MTLAEALIYRKDILENNTRLLNRISKNAIVTEGTKPQEDPEKLLSQLRDNFRKITNLIASINHTNMNVSIGKMTLADALAHRQILELEITALTNVRNACYVYNRGKKKDDLKDVSLLKVTNLTKEINGKSTELRKLNAEIQKVNWITDLMEVELEE